MTLEPITATRRLWDALRELLGLELTDYLCHCQAVAKDLRPCWPCRLQAQQRRAP